LFSRRIYQNSSDSSVFEDRESVIFLRRGRTYSEQKENDAAKTSLAKSHGYKIARIPYWLDDEEIEIEIDNILAGKPTYPDIPDPKQESTKPKPIKN
jgi:hypothetical protein